MLKVALTGNIASGKSTVAAIWRGVGARVVEADDLARRAVEPGTEALAAIRSRWGEGVLRDDGRLDRPVLREIVFRDPGERARLEQIVHPEVQRLRAEEFDAAEAAGADIIVADIPLLFEVGLEKSFDLVVLVHAPEDIRLQRLVRDRGLDAGEARRMIGAQMPSERKRAHADVVIDNVGTMAELEVRARAVWGDLRRRAGESG